MSRHSTANAAVLVKANHELRSRVDHLEQKLNRAESAIAKAVEIASEGKEEHGSLSVRTNPTTLLALAESIAQSSTPLSSPLAQKIRTPPPSGTAQERIESLVVSNKELRFCAV